MRLCTLMFSSNKGNTNDLADCMQISVMITTRNRCANLRQTLTRLASMNPPASEILVTADGCTDGTVALVQKEFSHCRLTVNETCLGSIRSRDRMLHDASGDVVMSLDDDSYPLEDDFFAKLPALFLAHPEVSVITFPELRDDGSFVPATKSPSSPGHYVSAYPNGAAAMRRSDYLKTTGYPASFFHAYEEPDYALQMYALGKAVWFDPSLVVRHHFSPTNRNNLRTHHFNARNELWSVWMRCPWPWLPFVSLFRILRQFAYACSNGGDWMIQEPRWWLSALKGWQDCRENRWPVPSKTYLAWMQLARWPLYQVDDFRRIFVPEQAGRAAEPEKRPHCS
jgi:glycosyltransferase involved in cell wall biosynthesis